MTRIGSIILWMALLMTGLYLERLSNYQRRFADFDTIAKALERYRFDHGAYPVTEGSTSNRKKGWIPELVPDYLSSVPRDPRYLRKNKSKQYLYISNGRDYKLIAHAPEDFGFVSQRYPELIDPARHEFAYGIWTAGGSSW